MDFLQEFSMLLIRITEKKLNKGVKNNSVIVSELSYQDIFPIHIELSNFWGKYLPDKMSDKELETFINTIDKECYSRFMRNPTKTSLMDYLSTMSYDNLSCFNFLLAFTGLTTGDILKHIKSKNAFKWLKEEE